jgi:glycosyltransferase involved in cell wall biosynthesis
MSKKKIALIFNHDFLLGGGEISFFELIRQLTHTAFEPVCIVPAKGEISSRLQSIGIQVFPIDMPPLRQLITGQVLRSILRLCRLIQYRKIDIIHVNGSRACFYGGLAGMLSNTPVIWHVRETKKDIWLYDYFLGAMSKVIICVSNTVKVKRFRRLPRQISNKAVVLYNGVDTAKFSVDIKNKHKFRKKLNINGDICLFGLVANIVSHKGQAFLINGYARAKELNSHLKAKILMIGRLLDLEYKKRLDLMIKQKKLDEEIILFDYMPDVRGIYAALDVSVLPSTQEGFSRAILESMSMGLPILASNIGEIREAVVDGENGILFDIDDIETMASAINSLAASAQMRAAMGSENRMKSIREFSLKFHTRAVQNIYAKLLT